MDIKGILNLLDENCINVKILTNYIKYNSTEYLFFSVDKMTGFKLELYNSSGDFFKISHWFCTKHYLNDYIESSKPLK